MPLTIYIEKHTESLVAHAKAFATANEKADVNLYDPRPRGIPHALAKYLVSCDDCDDRFWASNEYANHPGCKQDKVQPGF